MPRMRHLHPTQVESALRRGGQTEQLLGVEHRDGAVGVVRWMSLAAVADRFELRFHEAEDVGSTDYADVASFPSVDPEDEFGEGRVMAAESDVQAILDVASGLGAVVDRWVNHGGIDDEYLYARWGVA